MAKVKNISVKLQNGSKEYLFKNLILDSLLVNYANSLVDDYNKIYKSLAYCQIKFSKLENINENMEIQNSDFDICLTNTSIETIASTNKITNKYICDSEIGAIFDYNKAEQGNLSDYIGNKIYAIGFNWHFYSLGKISAVLDVSNYDIYIEEGMELRITRIDEISTDAIFTSLSEKINSPIHLYPNGIKGILPSQTLISKDGMASKTISYNAYAKLVNFGLSNTSDNIDVEYNIDGNYEVIDNVFKIKNIWSPKGIYPAEDVFPNNDLFPDDSPYKYLMLRFKLYQKIAEGTYENYEEVETDTGAEYLQAIPLDKKGFVDLNIKYERG